MDTGTDVGALKERDDRPAILRHVKRALSSVPLGLQHVPRPVLQLQELQILLWGQGAFPLQLIKARLLPSGPGSGSSPAGGVLDAPGILGAPEPIQL